MPIYPAPPPISKEGQHINSSFSVVICNRLQPLRITNQYIWLLQGIWKSPDDELLTLAATDGAIILMTARDLEPLLEFQPDEATDAAFANVNVGWGAKETQFHGKAGKESRTVGEIQQDKVNNVEKRSTKIVWRDDGQYFAVSYISNIDQIRRIRVFNREGQLQSTSEPVKQLGTALGRSNCYFKITPLGGNT